jgi:hypothetical protein
LQSLKYKFANKCGARYNVKPLVDAEDGDALEAAAKASANGDEGAVGLCTLNQFDP